MKTLAMVVCWSVGPISCVVFCLFILYSAQFNSNLHQTLHTGGHWSGEELFSFGRNYLKDEPRI